MEDPGDHTKAVLVLTACWCSGAGAVSAAEQLHVAPWGPHAELQGRRLVPALAPVQAHLPTLQRWDTAPLLSLYNLDIIHCRAGAAQGGAQRAGRLLAGGQGGPAPGHPGLNR